MHFIVSREISTGSGPHADLVGPAQKMRMMPDDRRPKPTLSSVRPLPHMKHPLEGTERPLDPIPGRSLMPDMKGLKWELLYCIQNLTEGSFLQLEVSSFSVCS